MGDLQRVTSNTYEQGMLKAETLVTQCRKDQSRVWKSPVKGQIRAKDFTRERELLPPLHLLSPIQKGPWKPGHRNGMEQLSTQAVLVMQAKRSAKSKSATQARTALL